jgi:hypothetical protein
MIYSCRSGSKCKYTSATERGLHLHRLACDYYKHYEAAALAKRKSIAEQKKKAVTKDKRSRKGRGSASHDVGEFGSVRLLSKFDPYLQLTK